MSFGKPVIPTESEAEIESEEVRITISGGKMEEVDEAPHRKPKDPFLEELDNLSSLSPSPCIYRVPKRLRRGKKEAYTPQVVSIGPLHHGEENLKGMEEHKKRYLKVFLSRTGERVSFSDYIKMIKEHESRLRGFYAESIEFGREEFVRIVLVDAAFVIEFLLRYHYKYFSSKDENSQTKDDYSQGKDDYIFNNPKMLWDVIPDLRLLENQLPFFILQDLFKRFSSSYPHHLPLLLKISCDFFGSEIDGEGKKMNFDKICSSGIQHFVDLIRILYLPSESKTEETLETTAAPDITTTATPNITATATSKGTATTTSEGTATPNVTELHQAGVDVKPNEKKGRSLLDIKFSRGVLGICGILEIPKLRVDDTTDLTLRNLLAFEQCHHGEKDYLANYVFLMKRLAKTPEDVQLLVEKKIIDNWLGDTKKISTLLHDLGTGMVVDDHYYSRLCEDLIEYRGKRWPKWMVILKQKYFNSPWSTISVAAAVILLILTLVQTVCSLKSVP